MSLFNQDKITGAVVDALRLLLLPLPPDPLPHLRATQDVLAKLLDEVNKRVDALTLGVTVGPAKVEARVELRESTRFRTEAEACASMNHTLPGGSGKLVLRTTPPTCGHCGTVLNG